jgi:hypothetical protein
MELMTLDGYFRPQRFIENYESLIWTERYSVNGDFELTTNDVQRTMNLLPLESYVALRESNVPMIVEAHKINKPKNAEVTLTVSGRSFETILERRGSVISLPGGGGSDATGPGARPVWNVNADKQSDAAYKAIRAVIGDPIARGALPILNPAVSPLDAFKRADNSYILDLPLPSDYSAGLTTAYEIKAGNLYGVVLELLEPSHRGLKSVRPTVDSKTTVDLQFYNGADLRATVVFDAKFDQFNDSTYLLSYQGSTNIAYVYGGGPAAVGSTPTPTNGGTSVRKNTAGSEVFGLDRRVLIVDEMSDTTLNTPTIRTSRGLVELYKNNATALFDGQISEQVGNRFNKPTSEGGYGLGDIVKLNGEYGVSRDVRVAEFIRTEDATGSKAYPAFQVVE